MGIEEMATKGKRKLARKIPTMAASYEASRSRAVENFRGVGFGPTRTAAYESAWSDMPEHYRSSMTTEKAEKWAKNWIAKMRE